MLGVSTHSLLHTQLYIYQAYVYIVGAMTNQSFMWFIFALIKKFRIQETWYLLTDADSSTYFLFPLASKKELIAIHQPLISTPPPSAAAAVSEP